MKKPRYPVYVISKGRSDRCLTAAMLSKDNIPFRLIVEPEEGGAYRDRFGDTVETLPFSNLGLGSIPARNWVWEDAKSRGAERHWILDDNIRSVRRMFAGKRIRCAAGPALRAVEDFSDRYENVAIAGLNYHTFQFRAGMPAFYLNVHVYSCMLIKSGIPWRWRGRYNEDTDLCLQVLSGGWCTVLVNAFSVEKMATMTMRGGNSDSLYRGDGRLKMARSLERAWPGVVSVSRRFKRPQHVVRRNWRGFDTPLRRKEGLQELPTIPDEYGLFLEKAAPTMSRRMADVFEKYVNSRAKSE